MYETFIKYKHIKAIVSLLTSKNADDNGWELLKMYLNKIVYKKASGYYFSDTCIYKSNLTTKIQISSKGDKGTSFQATIGKAVKPPLFDLQELQSHKIVLNYFEP